MTTNNDYFCYCWRDAVTDPPEKRWTGLGKSVYGVFLAWRLPLDGVWTWERQRSHDETWVPQPGDQWLDITAIPAVPRETVQAAVDEMASSNYAAGPAVQLVEAGDDAIDFCIDVIADHTGITPSTAEESSVAQEAHNA